MFYYLILMKMSQCPLIYIFFKCDFVLNTFLATSFKWVISTSATSCGNHFNLFTSEQCECIKLTIAATTFWGAQTGYLPDSGFGSLSWVRDTFKKDPRWTLVATTVLVGCELIFQIVCFFMTTWAVTWGKPALWKKRECKMNIIWRFKRNGADISREEHVF